MASADFPTRWGQFRIFGFEAANGETAVALVMGYVKTAKSSGTAPLVRVHSQCLTGDVFGSLRCDCGPQLDAALAAVAREGRGVVLYVRGHEGRG